MLRFILIFLSKTVLGIRIERIRSLITMISVINIMFL